MYVFVPSVIHMYICMYVFKLNVKMLKQKEKQIKCCVVIEVKLIYSLSNTK